MSIRHLARVMVALVAAYAMALQAVLLAIGGPMVGATDFAAAPICASAGSGHSAPAGPSHDCLGACLAGYCCGAPVAPAPGAGVAYVAEPGQGLLAVLEATPTLLRSATGAHRSRAPPVA